VYGIPSWLAAIVFIGGFGVISVGGLQLMRRFLPASDFDHNDVAGPIVATIGTVLAVMLSFMVVTVWQEYDQAASIVNTEAGQIADLYHEAIALPAAPRQAIRSGLRHYVSLLVHEEWPLMRSGQTSTASKDAILRVVKLVEKFAPTTMAQQNAQADALRHSHGVLDARRNRLSANAQSVPGLLWAVMFFVTIVTISSSYFFRVRNFAAHLIMTFALAAVIGAIFMTIAELDLPFRGDLQIPPSAYSQDVNAFADESKI